MTRPFTSELSCFVSHTSFLGAASCLTPSVGSWREQARTNPAGTETSALILEGQPFTGPARTPLGDAGISAQSLGLRDAVLVTLVGPPLPTSPPAEAQEAKEEH